MPTTFRDRDLQPVLVIPIQHDIGWAEPTSARSLSALLGRSRSLVLAAIATGPCSTTKLAKQTGTPLATASRQAAVLRDAGLIATRRCGQSVLHSVTPLGLALLAGS